MSFDVDAFVHACTTARATAEPAVAVADVVRSAIADPGTIEQALAELDAAQPQPSAMHIFHSSDDLTIFHVAVEPHVYGVPHDHATWAVIGVFGGAESFNQYRCDDGVTLVPCGADVIQAGEVRILRADVIHDLQNPSSTVSRSLHVYGNRFFDVPARRIWRSPTASVSPFTIEKVVAWGKATTDAQRRSLGIDASADPVLPDMRHLTSRA